MTSRRFGGIFPAIFALTATSAIASGGCGIENALVDGSCADGYTECDLRCVDVRADDAHCGACDVECPAGVACVEGACGGSSVGSGAGAHDASGGDANGSDAGDANSSYGSDGSNDASVDDGAPKDGSIADAPPLDGSSGDGSSGDGSTSGNGGDGGACTLPTTSCAGVCIDLTASDAYNCGACGKICPSGICAAGVCQGATPGDLVVIGHDFTASAPSVSQARVLTNAVLLPTSNPLRVLSYEEFADTGAVSNVKSVVGTRASSVGRALTYTVSTHSSDLESATLADSYDVILVYDQGATDDATATSIGAAWSSYLVTFAKAGGVIVVLDGAEGNEVMPTLLESATLLSLAGHTLLATPPSHVVIAAASDDVAVKVISPYAAVARTVSLQSNEGSAGVVSWVARAGDDPNAGDPVVIHKTFE